MERRVALAAASAAGVSLAVGTFCFAAIGGASILGLGGSEVPWAAPPDPLVVTQYQTLEDVVVVVSSPDTPPDGLPIDTASDLGANVAGSPISKSPLAAFGPGTSGSVTASGPVPTASAADEGAAPDEAVPTTATTPTADSPSTGTTTPEPVSTMPPAGPVTTPPASNTTAAPKTSTSPTTVPSTTAAPAMTAAPTTNAAPVASPTTTVRPPGVPADWPADKPIPPMPANCKKPQLEDNGVWNCEH